MTPFIYYTLLYPPPSLATPLTLPYEYHWSPLIASHPTLVTTHRTPTPTTTTRMYSYAQTAVERGLQVIIAGAGGAAHLPGMVTKNDKIPLDTLRLLNPHLLRYAFLIYAFLTPSCYAMPS